MNMYLYLKFFLGGGGGKLQILTALLEMSHNPGPVFPQAIFWQWWYIVVIGNVDIWYFA